MTSFLDKPEQVSKPAEPEPQLKTRKTGKIFSQKERECLQKEKSQSMLFLYSKQPWIYTLNRWLPFCLKPIHTYTQATF